jgi:hypothetical protein
VYVKRKRITHKRAGTLEVCEQVSDEWVSDENMKGFKVEGFAPRTAIVDHKKEGDVNAGTEGGEGMVEGSRC